MNSTSNSDFFNPLRLVWLALALCAAPAWAQFKVDVTGVGMTQLPIAIAPFRGEDLAPQKSAAIVLADLERSGQFRGVDSAGLSLDESSRPDMSNVRQRNADALLAGSVQRLADGRVGDAVGAVALGLCKPPSVGTRGAGRLLGAGARRSPMGMVIGRVLVQTCR